MKYFICRWLVILLLSCTISQAQTLKRRTEPKLVEESCRDHLIRLSKSFYKVHKETINSPEYRNDLLIISENLLAMSSEEALNRSPVCTKKYLSRLDIFAALAEYNAAQEKLLLKE